MQNIVKVLIVAFVLIVFPAIVFGQVTWNMDQLIEDNAVYLPSGPQVAISDNNVVAVWEQYDGGTIRISSNYSTNGGTTWGSDQLIDDYVVGFHGHSPKVAASGNNVVAVWERDEGSAHHICSNYSTDGGVTWGSDQLIEDNVGFNAALPKVAASGNNVVAVWRQYDGSHNRIYYNRSSDRGATWGSDQLIEDNVGFDANSPQVAISGNTVVAVWQQWDGSKDRIYYNRSTDGGATWGSDQLIEDNVGFHNFNPQVAISGNTVVAVWLAYEGSNYRVYANYSANGGATWGSDQLIEDNVGFSAAIPQVAISGNTVVAVWLTYEVSNAIYRVCANYSANGGATWGSDQLIEDNVGFSAFGPQVAISGNTVVAVWQQYDGSKNRIYSNYSTDGGVTWGSDQLIEDNVGFNAALPKVAASGNNVVAVWEQQYDWDSERIYSTNGVLEGQSIPVYRFWSPAYGHHFYTISEYEKNYVIATWPETWTYEGPVFYAYTTQVTGTLPVYRFWSDTFMGHFYTISEYEKNYVIATWPETWTYEGPVFYAYPSE
jgi:hypothetical protein